MTIKSSVFEAQQVNKKVQDTQGHVVQDGQEKRVQKIKRSLCCRWQSPSIFPFAKENEEHVNHSLPVLNLPKWLSDKSQEFKLTSFWIFLTQIWRVGKMFWSLKIFTTQTFQQRIFMNKLHSNKIDKSKYFVYWKTTCIKSACQIAKTISMHLD